MWYLDQLFGNPGLSDAQAYRKAVQNPDFFLMATYELTFIACPTINTENDMGSSTNGHPEGQLPPGRALHITFARMPGCGLEEQDSCLEKPRPIWLTSEMSSKRSGLAERESSDHASVSNDHSMSDKLATPGIFRSSRAHAGCFQFFENGLKAWREES
jgi:hypothetical protein